MEHDGAPQAYVPGPRGPLPPWERPPVPNRVEPDPYLSATVALLNLTGLGLGYALLRRWIATGVCLVASTVLLLVVLPVDPDRAPTAFVAAYLAIIGVTVIHGAVAGLEAPRRPRPAKAPVGLLVSIALLAVPVTGVVWYSETVQHQLLDRLASADRLVRDAQGEPFATAKPDFHKALQTYAYLVDRHPTSRATGKVPDRLRAYYAAVGAPYAKKHYCAAVAPLKDLRTVPRTIDREELGDLAGWPDERLPTALLECGVSRLGRDASTTELGGELYDLLNTYPRSAAAKKVGPALTAADARLAGKLSGDDPCPVVSDLDTLDDQVTDLMGHPKLPRNTFKDIDEKIQGHIQSGTYACGVDQYKDHHFGDALKTMNDFVRRYEDDKRVPMAKKIAIAAKIATKLPAAGRHLPTSASGGSVRVTFYNDSTFKTRLLYTGKVTGSTSVGACGGCFEYVNKSVARQFACSPGRHYPHTSVRLPVGTVYLLQDSLSSRIKPNAGKLVLRGGNISLCLFTAAT